MRLGPDFLPPHGEANGGGSKSLSACAKETDGAPIKLNWDFWIDEAQAGDLPAITAILNHAAANTTASWHEYPKSDAEMADWFAARKQSHTVLAARDASGFWAMPLTDRSVAPPDTG